MTFASTSIPPLTNEIRQELDEIATMIDQATSQIGKMPTSQAGQAVYQTLLDAQFKLWVVRGTPDE